jgi:hypothetical protein
MGRCITIIQGHPDARAQHFGNALADAYGDGGDGHARQGDGEVTGQGLETSMDVQFRVEVIENRSIGQPWIEDGEYVMVMGIGGSLDQAFTLSTTGMLRWLKTITDSNQTKQPPCLEILRNMKLRKPSILK